MKENKKKIQKLLTKVKKIVRFKKKFIPLHEPTIQKKDIDTVTNCLKSTFIIFVACAICARVCNWIAKI